MIYYIVRSWSTTIEEVEVERVTEHSVFVAAAYMGQKTGRRHAKHGESYNFYPTHQEAIHHIKNRLTERLNKCYTALTNATAELVAFNELHKEEQP